ncbi:MAG: Holliday junction branch migration protein RuvA [Christensenellales bacterium]
MISFLKGRVVEQVDGGLIIDVNGVGYELNATATCMGKFEVCDQVVTIPTYLAVREDCITLFGFANNNEKSMFLKLITVSGVGPKLAITILSGTKVDELCLIIATSDVNALSKIKGLGKKTAEKIILELKEKVGVIGNVTPLSAGSQLGIDSQATEDACVALCTLGINRVEALKLIQKVAKPEMSAEQIIKLCLKDMAK